MWLEQKTYTCLSCGVESGEPSILCHPIDTERIESRKLCTIDSKPEPKDICKPLVPDVNFECDTCRITSSNKELLCYPRKV